MNKTRMKIALLAATMISVSAYSSVLAHAQNSGLNGLDGLDADRTGRIAGAPVNGTGTVVAPAALHERRESSVTPAAAKALAPPPPGVLAEEVLAVEIASRFESLELCRIDVARGQRVPTGDVEADRLTLRWTIEPTGRVTAAEVVGTTAVDAHVLDCVKRQMTGWTFSRPSGGPLPIERTFTFRSAPPSATAN
jgi:hypothetical protein